MFCVINEHPLTLPGVQVYYYLKLTKKNETNIRNSHPFCFNALPCPA